MDRGPSVRRVVALLLFVEFALFVVDLVMESTAIAAAFALPVAVMALVAGPRATAAFGLLAVLLALIVGASAQGGMDARDVIRVGIVLGVATVATVGATGRRRLERDISRLELLAALGPESVSGRSAAQVAGGLLDSLVPAFADGAAVDLAGGERLAVRGRAPGSQDEGAPRGRDGMATLALELRAPGGEIGRVVACRLPGRGRFTRADARFGQAAAARIALAVENARLMEELTHAEATQRHIADVLQSSLRPSGLPEVPGVRLATFYRAMGEATEVGGDFYDVFPVSGGHLLVIGDVTGKGAAAASITALARGALGAAAAQSGSAVEAVARLDELLGRRDELTLCSVACVHLRADEDGMSASVVLAGHPPVLLLRDGAVRPLGDPGPLPGAFADVHWRASHVDLLPGDVIVLRTDGVTDTVGADGRLGEDRLRRVLAGLPAGDVDGAVARIRAAVEEHTVGEQRDDTAVLAAAVTERSAAAGASAPGSFAVELQLPGDPASVSVARRAVRERLGPGLAPDELDAVCLLVSELASNAVRHGGAGSYRLELSCDAARVGAAVVDPGGGFVRPAVRRDGDGLSEGGYGLSLVECLADRWGIEEAGGTRVWFERDRR